jgi:hypothetical protein
VAAAISTIASMATNNINFFIAYLLFVAIPHGLLVLAIIPKGRYCQKSSRHKYKIWLSGRVVRE